MKKNDLDSTLKQLNNVIDRLTVAKEDCNNALESGYNDRARQYFSKIAPLYDKCNELSLKYLEHLLQEENPQQGLSEVENLMTIIQSAETFFDAFSIDIDDIKSQNFINLEIYKGICLLKLQKYRRALKSFDTILEIDDSMDGIWALKGNALLEMGNYDEAFDAFETAINLEWNNADAWVGKGKILQSSENFAEALEAFDTALEIDDTNLDAIQGKEGVMAGINSDPAESEKSKITPKHSQSQKPKKTNELPPPYNFNSPEKPDQPIHKKTDKKVFKKPLEMKKDTTLKGFASVAGMNEIKNDLTKDIIEPLRRKDEAKKFGVSIPNGFLFFGPPGCGKTFIVRKLAEEIGYHYKEFSASDVGSKWAHETSGNIAKIFEEAKNNAPTILFFDEIDALVPKRESLGSEQWKQEEITEFLNQMNNASENEVLVIGATNKPDMIDDAILRSGRMDKRIYIRPPDLDARKDLFNKQLEGRAISKDIDMAELAGLTENYASSDIALVVNNAARTAFSEGYSEINQEMLKYIIEKTQSSLTKSQISAYEKFKNYERR